MITVRRYLTADGKDVVGDWLAGLKDRVAKARILVRIDRLAAGNFGDCKSLRSGVSELRIDHGPGYRVYFGRIGDVVVLLLCGGDKRTQDKDIVRAADLLEDFRRRTS